MKEVLVFTLLGRSYKINFPTVGQYRDIETLKQTLSGNNYGSMSRSLLVSANEALDMVDIESYMTVLCPDLIRDLKCDSFSQLGLKDYTILRDEFKKQFLPWWVEIEALLRPEHKIQEKDEETK